MDPKREQAIRDRRAKITELATIYNREYLHVKRHEYLKEGLTRHEALMRLRDLRFKYEAYVRGESI